jgi:hypothetical protein
MGAEMKVETCLDMFQFLAIFGRAPALSCIHVFLKKVTLNGHSPTNFCILNVSNFLADVTHGKFCAERTLSLLDQAWKQICQQVELQHFSLQATSLHCCYVPMLYPNPISCGGNYCI